MSIDPATPDGRQPRDILRIVWEGKYIIAACFALALIAAVLYTSTITEEYVSKARVLISDTDPGDPTGSGGNEDPDVRAATVLDLATQPAIATEVVKRLNLPYGPDVVAEKVSADLKPNSRVLTIQALDESPEQAKRLVDAYAAAFVAFRADLSRNRNQLALDRLRRQLNQVRRQPDTAERQQRITELQDQIGTLEVRIGAAVGDSEVIQKGGVPSVPATPNKTRNYALGGIFGLLFGLGLAGLRDRLDPRVKDESQLRSLMPGVPILATLPPNGRGPKGQAVTAEAFRTLQANLTFLDIDRPLRSLLVTSSGAGEGKATTTLNLALAMAERGQRVLVVDGNLRRSSLTETLELERTQGVSNFLSGHGARLDEFLRHVELERADLNGSGPSIALSGQLWIVPSGPVPPNPGALLNSSTLDSLLEQARDAGDRLIINGAPLGPFSDMLPVARRADGVIVVVRLYHSRREDIERLLMLLSQASVRPLGVVVFGVRGLA